jgi:hypothetical protein
MALQHVCKLEILGWCGITRSAAFRAPARVVLAAMLKSITEYLYVEVWTLLTPKHAIASPFGVFPPQYEMVSGIL